MSEIHGAGDAAERDTVGASKRLMPHQVDINMSPRLPQFELVQLLSQNLKTDNMD